MIHLHNYCSSTLPWPFGTGQPHNWHKHWCLHQVWSRTDPQGSSHRPLRLRPSGTGRPRSSGRHLCLHRVWSQTDPQSSSHRPLRLRPSGTGRPGKKCTPTNPSKPRIGRRRTAHNSTHRHRQRHSRRCIPRTQRPPKSTSRSPPSKARMWSTPTPQSSSMPFPRHNRCNSMPPSMPGRCPQSSSSTRLRPTPRTNPGRNLGRLCRPPRPGRCQPNSPNNRWTLSSPSRFLCYKKRTWQSLDQSNYRPRTPNKY